MAELLWLALAIMLMGFAALAGLTWLVMFVSECVGEHRLWRLEGEMELIRRLIEDRRFVVIDTATGMAYIHHVRCRWRSSNIRANVPCGMLYSCNSIVPMQL